SCIRVKHSLAIITPAIALTACSEIRICRNRRKACPGFRCSLNPGYDLQAFGSQFWGAVHTMWPFTRKQIVDADTAQWHVDNFAWLVATFGGNEAFAGSVLVLPKPGFFPTDGQEGHARALHILERVKHYCGMEDWPVELVPDHNPAADRSSTFSVAMPVHGKHAQGTFSVAGNAVQISYVPDLLAHPERLIATFAHELAHYLLA